MSVILPGLSVVLGALITYLLNVRQDRVSAVDGLFVCAIAATAAVDASAGYVSGAPPWQGASEEEHRALLSDWRKEATLNHLRKVSEAREAIAQVVPFAPSLSPLAGLAPGEFLSRVPATLDALRAEHWKSVAGSHRVRKMLRRPYGPVG